jgi:glycosyltransferase involved in cell wall biosynthesis
MPPDVYERQAPAPPEVAGGACGSVGARAEQGGRDDRSAAEITVVVPVYNTAIEHLEESVGSILRQTMRPREIQVIDDGSTLAGTRDRLDDLRARAGVRLVRNERNLSLGPTMNRALLLCETPFVLKLDSDDLARPRLIERYDAFLSENRDFDVLGCQCQNFGQSNFASQHPFRVTRDYAVHSRGHWIVNHTGVLLNRESVLAVKGYRRMRGLSEDYELWVRMMLRGFRRFYNLPEILVDYRDLPTGAHHNSRRGFNRGMKILLKALMRTCPRF